MQYQTIAKDVLSKAVELVQRSLKGPTSSIDIITLNELRELAHEFGHVSYMLQLHEMVRQAKERQAEETITSQIAEESPVDSAMTEGAVAQADGSPGD